MVSSPLKARYPNAQPLAYYWSLTRAFCEARDFAVHLNPRNRVVAKNLPPRFRDGRIVKRPYIQNNGIGSHCRLFGDRRAAFGAEVPEDRVPAAADATERLEHTLDRHRLLGHSNQRGKGAAGE